MLLSHKEKLAEGRAADPAYQSKEADAVAGDIVMGQDLRVVADPKGYILELLRHAPEHRHNRCFQILNTKQTHPPVISERRDTGGRKHARGRS